MMGKRNGRQLLHQPISEGVANEVDRGRKVELCQDARSIGGNGRWAQDKLRGDFFHPFSCRQEAQHLVFPIRQELVRYCLCVRLKLVRKPFSQRGQEAARSS